MIRQILHQTFGHNLGPFNDGNTICLKCNSPWFDTRHSLIWRIGRSIGAVPQYKNQAGNWMRILPFFNYGGK